MYPTLAEATELVSCARERGLFVAVGLVERFNPVVAFALQELPKLGKILATEARCLKQRPSFPVYPTRHRLVPTWTRWFGVFPRTRHAELEDFLHDHP